MNKKIRIIGLGLLTSFLLISCGGTAAKDTSLTVESNMGSAELIAKLLDIPAKHPYIRSTVSGKATKQKIEYTGSLDYKFSENEKKFTILTQPDVSNPFMTSAMFYYVQYQSLKDNYSSFISKSGVKANFVNNNFEISYLSSTSSSYVSESFTYNAYGLLTKLNVVNVYKDESDKDIDLSLNVTYVVKDGESESIESSILSEVSIPDSIVSVSEVPNTPAIPFPDLDFTVDESGEITSSSSSHTVEVISASTFASIASSLPASIYNRVTSTHEQNVISDPAADIDGFIVEEATGHFDGIGWVQDDNVPGFFNELIEFLNMPIGAYFSNIFAIDYDYSFLKVDGNLGLAFEGSIQRSYSLDKLATIQQSGFFLFNEYGDLAYYGESRLARAEQADASFKSGYAEHRIYNEFSVDEDLLSPATIKESMNIPQLQPEGAIISLDEYVSYYLSILENKKVPYTSATVNGSYSKRFINDLTASAESINIVDRTLIYNGTEWVFEGDYGYAPEEHIILSAINGAIDFQSMSKKPTKDELIIMLQGSTCFKVNGNYGLISVVGSSLGGKVIRDANGYPVYLFSLGHGVINGTKAFLSYQEYSLIYH